MEDIKQKLQIIEAVNAIVNTADNKDWDACAACFTSEVVPDHDAHLHAQPVIISSWKVRSIQYKQLFDQGDPSVFKHV